MKNLLQKTTMAILICLAIFQTNAQTNIPQFTNFQAVARDDSNNPIVSKPIQIELTLRQGSSTGTAVYGAIYQDSTNQYGEFSRELGSVPDAAVIIGGNPVNTILSAVPWQNGNIWVVIRYKPQIAGPWKDMGSAQYKSVPFCFSSRTAEKLMTPATTGQVLIFDGTSWVAGANPGVPIGTIIAFGGEPSTIPTGWLLCDGTAYPTATYPSLFAAIGNAWGSGGAGSFNVPELRGMFLRGWSQSNIGASVNDPEYNLRLPSNPGGAVNNHVGSKQSDALQGHNHRLFFTIASSGSATQTGFLSTPSTGSGLNPTASNYSDGSLSGPAADGTNGNPRIAQESRPKNAYVMYIIKYQ